MGGFVVRIQGKTIYPLYTIEQTNKAIGQKEGCMTQEQLNQMTQEQKDLLLQQLLEKQLRESAMNEAKKLGIGLSTGGFISIRMPKVGTKNQPALYIDPQNIETLKNLIPKIETFAEANK